MRLKPEVTAPGGKYLPSVPGGGYQAIRYVHGNAPGASAVVLGAFRTTRSFPSLNDRQKVDVIQNLIQELVTRLWDPGTGWRCHNFA